MANTTFIDGSTPIISTWLNDVNSLRYIELISTNTVLNVPGTYATIQTALDYLSNKRIIGNAIVQIKVADGTYNFSSTLDFNHPDGTNIQLIGNESTPTNCVLNWGSTGAGIDGITVSNFHTLYINGFHITRTAHAGTISIGLLADNNSTIVCGTSLKVSNWYYGIVARTGSVVYCRNAIVDGAGDVGIWAYQGSTIDARNSSVTNSSYSPFGYGIEAEFNSFIDATYASASSCLVAGIAALSNSVVRAVSSTSSSNLRSGFFARDGGVIDIQGSSGFNTINSNNTTFGLESITNGKIISNAYLTQSGNGTNKNNNAELNSDSSLGARVSSNSGSLRIDTTDTSSIFCNTSGGNQLEVFNTNSATRKVQITGATSSGNPRIQASGGSLDISSTVVFTNQTTGTTVGAAGGASALPATPLGYITTSINGISVKIPYYNT